MRTSWVISLVLLCALPTGAAAQDDERERFEAGVSAFQRGAWEEALEHFRGVYETTQHPDLLYNIGSCLDRLRQDSEALEAFEAYLEARPDSEDREAVEARIRALRRNLQARDEAQPRDEAEPPGPTAERGYSLGGPGPASIVTAALALVAGGVAIGSWVHAESVHAGLEAGCGRTQSCSRAEIDESGGPLAVDLTNAFLGAAIGLGALAVALYFIEPIWSSDGDDVEVSAGPGALRLDVRF